MFTIIFDNGNMVVVVARKVRVGVCVGVCVYVCVCELVLCLKNFLVTTNSEIFVTNKTDFGVKNSNCL